MITAAKKTDYGFSLLEMSVVLLILSLMLGGILAALTQESRRSQRAQLMAKMDVIEQALLGYSKKSTTYALPCPGPITAITNSTFGVAVASGCATATYKGSGAATGIVPVRTLGLADEYAFDPWGNLFTYTVSQAAATTNAFSGTRPMSTSVGALTITDTSANNRTTTAVAVLLSHGPDGFGSFTRSGARKSGYSSNTSQRTNCHCLANASDGTYDANYVMGFETLSSSDAENNFDDILRYWGRENFLLTPEIYTEKP